MISLINSGVIIELKRNKVIVMTKHFDFVEVKRQPQMASGQKIKFTQNDIYGVQKVNSGILVKCISAVSLVVAVFILVMNFNFSMFYKNEFAYVGIDINPGVEFSLDNNAEVIASKHLNNDGKMVLSTIELDGKNIIDILEDVINKSIELGYLDDLDESDDTVLISVALNSKYKDSTEAEETFKSLLSSIDKLKDDFGAMKIKILKVSSEDRSAANKAKLSMGRYYLYERAKDLPGGISFNDIKEKSINELMNIVDGRSEQPKPMNTPLLSTTLDVTASPDEPVSTFSPKPKNTPVPIVETPVPDSKDNTIVTMLPPEAIIFKKDTVTPEWTIKIPEYTPELLVTPESTDIHVVTATPTPTPTSTPKPTSSSKPTDKPKVKPTESETDFNTKDTPKPETIEPKGTTTPVNKTTPEASVTSSALTTQSVSGTATARITPTPLNTPKQLLTPAPTSKSTQKPEETPRVVSFTLVNADTGKNIRVINDDDEVYLSEIGGRLSIRADIKGNTDRVVFGLNNESNYSTVVEPPYIVTIGKENSFDYKWMPSPPKEYTITAVPYSTVNGVEIKGRQLTIKVSVNDFRPVTLSKDAKVTGFTLVSARSNRDIMELKDGEKVNISEIGTSFNVRADVTENVNKVIFGLDGNFFYKVDGEAPFILDISIDKLSNNIYPSVIGPHFITATPYSFEKGIEIPGETVTIQINIDDGRSYTY